MAADLFDVPYQQPSSLSVEKSHMDTGDDSYSFGLELVDDTGWHWLMNGQSSSTSLPNKDLTVTSWQVGISNDPLSDYTIGGNYSKTDSADSLLIKTIQLELGVNFVNSWLTFEPRNRSIRVYLRSGLRNAPDYVDMDSNGYGLGWKYFGVPAWVFNLHYLKNEYSKDLSALDSRPRLIYLFSSSTLLLASGFTDSEWSAETNFQFAAGVIGLSWQQSRSAINQSITTTRILKYTKQLNTSMEIALQYGSTIMVAPGESYDFYAFGLNCYW